MSEAAELPKTTAVWNAGAFRAVAVAGTVGMLLIAIGGIFVGPTGPTGSVLERWARLLTPQGTARTVTSSIAVTVGLILVIGAWVALGLMQKRGAPLRPLVRISILWSLPLLLGPPIYSRDAYSYAALGRMVNLHIDPYRFGPAALGSHSPFLPPVSVIWRHTPSPYGPLFIKLSSGAVNVGGGSVASTVLLLRGGVEVVGMILIAIALPKLAIAAGTDPGRAFWLGVCNPLVLIHFIGGAHNDALMVGLLMCGLALGAMKRPGWGVALCMLGAAIKAPAAIGAAFIAVEAIRALPRGRRLAELARLSAIGIGVFGVISWYTGVGFGWLNALRVPGKNRMLLTPTVFVAHWISNVVGHDAGVLQATRQIGTLITAAGVAYLLWRAPKIGTVRACGLALALVVAFGPIVLPWYALWAVIVLAPSGRRIERGYAIFATIMLTLVVEPSGAAVPDVILMGTVIVLTAAAVAIAWRPVRTWIREDLAYAIEEYQRGGHATRVFDIVRHARPSGAAGRDERAVDSQVA